MRRPIIVVLLLLLAAIASPIVAQEGRPSDVAADFNDDGLADLAAAAPSEGVGSQFSAGAVSVLPGSAGGLAGSGGRLFTQDSPGVPGVAEFGDNFGGTALIAG